MNEFIYNSSHQSPILLRIIKIKLSGDEVICLKDFISKLEDIRAKWHKAEIIKFNIPADTFLSWDLLMISLQGTKQAPWFLCLCECMIWNNLFVSFTSHFCKTQNYKSYLWEIGWLFLDINMNSLPFFLLPLSNSSLCAHAFFNSSRFHLWKGHLLVWPHKAGQSLWGLQTLKGPFLPEQTADWSVSSAENQTFKCKRRTVTPRSRRWC